MSDCIFCSIVAGDLPSTKVHEDEHTYAFMDINPGTRGHCLVIPKAHATDLLEISPDDLAACAQTAQLLAGKAKTKLGADGVNLLNCCGADAWQTVFHFHFHVIPRFRDQPEKDDLQLPWIPTPGDPDQIAAAAAGLNS